MGSGEALLVGETQPKLVRQAEMQCLIGIEEGSRGCPKACEEAEQGDNQSREVGVGRQP
jgi:hypothetical protein